MKKIKNYLKSLLSRYYCSREEYYNLENLNAEIQHAILINSNGFWVVSVVCRKYYSDKYKTELITRFAFIIGVILILTLGPKLIYKILK